MGLHVDLRKGICSLTVGTQKNGSECLVVGCGVGLLGSFPKIDGAQYRPQNTLILIIGYPKKVALNF